MSTLEIKDLHVSVETEEGAKEILRGVTLTIESGQTHAIIGIATRVTIRVSGRPRRA